MGDAAVTAYFNENIITGLKIKFNKAICFFSYQTGKAIQ